MSITIDVYSVGAPTRPAPERDRWGRYRIPHPVTAKMQSWTRATTFASSIADTFGLSRWQTRMACYGLAHRPDLHAEAASVTDPDAGRATLDRIAEAAKEHAGTSTRARLGTALHAFAEQVDAGGDLAAIPEQWRPDIAAYRAAMDAAAVTIDPAHIERVVVIPQYQVAGTFDRLVMVDGRRYVADLKTGKDLSYSWTEIAIQLALYAHATHIFDPGTGELSPMPDVDLDRALVMHLPVGTATCTLHWVDIAAGWEAADLCAEVRTWRKRKGLARPVDTPPLPAEAPFGAATVADVLPAVVDDIHHRRTEWVVGRITGLKASPVARDVVRRTWPVGVPPKPPWTPEQIDALLPAVSAGEAEIRAPFPGSDPAHPSTVTPHTPPAQAPAHAPERTLPDGGPMIDGTATRAAAQALPAGAVAVMRRWLADAKRQGRPWGPPTTDQWPTRTVALVDAAVACLTHLSDDAEPDTLTRAALSVVLGEDVPPTWHTGAVVGSLTIGEAHRLTQIAGAFAADDDATVATLGRIAAASTPSQPHTGATAQ